MLSPNFQVPQVPLLPQCAHPSALLLFTVPLLPPRTQFKGRKCPQGTEAFRAAVAYTDAEPSHSREGRMEAVGKGASSLAAGRVFVHVPAAAHFPGCSGLSSAVGLTCA